jgi:hypothetical protein
VQSSPWRAKQYPEVVSQTHLLVVLVCSRRTKRGHWWLSDYPEKLAPEGLGLSTTCSVSPLMWGRGIPHNAAMKGSCDTGDL